MTEYDLALRLGLLLARPGALIMTAPGLGGRFVPAQVRIGLTLLLAFILMPLIEVPRISSLAGLSAIVLRELAIGLALALAVRALITGAELAGHLTGAQMMLSYGSVIDPQGGVRNTVMSSLYGNLTLLTFFIVGGHHMLLRGLASSYASVPIGMSGVDASLARSVTELLGVVFVVGLRLAAPLIVVMLIVELAAGLIARAAPAINPMAQATPFRVIVGLLVVSAMVPLVPGLVSKAVPLLSEWGLRMAQAFR